MDAKQSCVVMPTELTADNGAKAALMGEFHELVEVPCPECGLGDEDDYPLCDECGGEGWVTHRVVVGWDTIKEIYRKAVEVCGKESA